MTEFDVDFVLREYPDGTFAVIASVHRFTSEDDAIAFSHWLAKLLRDGMTKQFDAEMVGATSEFDFLLKEQKAMSEICRGYRIEQGKDGYCTIYRPNDPKPWSSQPSLNFAYKFIDEEKRRETLAKVRP